MPQTDTYIVPLLIGGQEIIADTTFDIVSPSTGQTIWKSSSTSLKDVQSAAEAAARAFPQWAATKPAFRRNVFLRAADILEKRSDECKQYMHSEMAAQPGFTSFNILTSVEILRDLAGRIASALTGSVPVCQDQGTNALVVKEPYGVVLGIAAWNAPYILGFRSIAYALAAGNTCILKGSEVSPRSFWAIGSILQEAGLPDGCLNVVYHRPQDAAEITAALIEHPAVKKINFTGSTAVGRIIASTAGKNLKPCLMELGGKASAVVCDDADLEKAAHHCTLGAFLNSGQICMSTERILVHKSILEPFTQAFKKAIAKLSPLTSDPVVVAQSATVERNKRLISSAITAGASLIYGGGDKETSVCEILPTAIGGVTREMEIFHIESFGPSVSLMAVESDEDAIAVANDTDYGLTSAVFSQNLSRALAIARKIESGAVHINSMTVHDEAGLPHGGIKNSGWGRFNADVGLNEFLKTKTITFQD